MKTIIMSKDFEYRPYGSSRVVVKYLAGFTYRRVPEAAVAKIVNAEAGSIKYREKTDA